VEQYHLLGIAEAIAPLNFSPAPNTLALLAQVSAKVLRTDVDGAIAIAADRHRLRIKTSKGSFNFIRWE
jgi:competence protein ComEC